MYNFIIIVCLIIFIFFLSADKALTKEIIRKNSLHIILFLLLIYFIYNNLHLGFLLLIILGIILYYTNFKTFILSNLSLESISSLKNYFPIDSILNTSEQSSEQSYEQSFETDSGIQESIVKVESKEDTEDERLNELMNQIHNELSN